MKEIGLDGHMKRTHSRTKRQATKIVEDAKAAATAAASAAVASSSSDDDAEASSAASGSRKAQPPPPAVWQCMTCGLEGSRVTLDRHASSAAVTGAADGHTVF